MPSTSKSLLFCHADTPPRVNITSHSSVKGCVYNVREVNKDLASRTRTTTGLWSLISPQGQELATLHNVTRSRVVCGTWRGEVDRIQASRTTESELVVVVPAVLLRVGTRLRLAAAVCSRTARADHVEAGVLSARFPVPHFPVLYFRLSCNRVSVGERKGISSLCGTSECRTSE